MSLLVVGFDPGPIPGLATLWWEGGAMAAKPPALVRWEAIQGTPELVLGVLGQLVEDHPGEGLLAVERFVRGNRARGRAGTTTSDMAAVVRSMPLPEGWRAVDHPAASVMRKVTERRLARVTGGLARLTGCAHATAALRHAVYASTADAGMPDPLSTRFVRELAGE